VSDFGVEVPISRSPKMIVSGIRDRVEGVVCAPHKQQQMNSVIQMAISDLTVTFILPLLRFFEGLLGRNHGLSTVLRSPPAAGIFGGRLRLGTKMGDPARSSSSRH